MQIKLIALSALLPGTLAQWGRGRERGGGSGGGNKNGGGNNNAQPPNPPYGATQSTWGQCGGRTYAGAVACPTGTYCRFDGNEWYQQCVPNNYPNHNDPPGNNPGGPGVVTRTITTVVTIDDPRPTRVTTFITYLQPITTPIRTTVVTLVPDQPWRPDE
ncbi:hypothetical protein RB596_000115 [Gaeumannomyces avenae]